MGTSGSSLLKVTVAHLQVSSTGGGNAVWSDDEIFWLDGNLLKSRRVTVGSEITLGLPVTMFRNGAFNWGYDVSADGSRIILGLTAGEEDDSAMVFVQNWFAQFAER